MIIQEVRAIIRCREIGIPAPAIFFVDTKHARIFMQHLTDGVTVRDFIFTQGVDQGEAFV